MIKRFLWLALLSPSAIAADNFAKQWPLQLEQAGAGAYRVQLDASVYAAAHWRDLRDVRVIDADGKLVASAVYPASVAAEDTTQTVELKWFVLPSTAESRGNNLDVVVQRDTQGNVLSIRNSVTASDTSQADSAWLVDLGDDAGKLRALLIDWADPAQSLDLGYRVEGSRDLRNWQVLLPEARVVQLHNQGRELRDNRIALESAPRYLRLQPLQNNSGASLRTLRGELASAAKPGVWQWQELHAQAGGNAKDGFDYALLGRYPVQRVDVVMPDNSTARLSLSSRDEDQRLANGDLAPWRAMVSDWNAWSLSERGKQQRSAPLQLGMIASDRQWRLQASDAAALANAPPLRVGYQPGSVVFLAQGRVPYLLVAGSAAAVPPQTTLEPMLAAQRERHGVQWQPAVANLGLPAQRAGDAAYQLAPKSTDWKSILLWVILIAGAVVVTGFAISLLRGNRSQNKAD